MLRMKACECKTAHEKIFVIFSGPPPKPPNLTAPSPRARGHQIPGFEPPIPQHGDPILGLAGPQGP